ncbi:hypothetical protein TNCV_1696451 [Trichonephila clavipes]|nr:hypothetical protein TNCV_1696451 [Trichonephila clavipes]
MRNRGGPTWRVILNVGNVVIVQLRCERIMRSFLIDECRITEFFSSYIFNFVKHFRSSSPDMMLIDEELYVVQAWKKVS